MTFNRRDLMRGAGISGVLAAGAPAIAMKSAGNSGAIVADVPAIPMLTIGEALDRYVERMEAIVIDRRKLYYCRRKLVPYHHVDAGDQRELAATVAAFTAGERAAGLSDSSTRRILIVLRAAVRRAWKDGILRYPPYVELPPAPPGRQRFLTAGEARQLISYIGQPDVMMFCVLALLTGARLGAIMDLTWSQIDFRAGLIDFRRGGDKSPRLKHRAIVPMTAPLRDMLFAHLDGARAKAPPKKCWEKRRRENHVIAVSPHIIHRRVAFAAQAAGLHGVTVHIFRHTAATWLRQAKIPMTMVSAQLGHKSTQTTEQVYAHLIAYDLAEASAVLARNLIPEPS